MDGGQVTALSIDVSFDKTDQLDNVVGEANDFSVGLRDKKAIPVHANIGISDCSLSVTTGEVQIPSGTWFHQGLAVSDSSVNEAIGTYSTLDVANTRMDFAIYADKMIVGNTEAGSFVTKLVETTQNDPQSTARDLLMFGRNTEPVVANTVYTQAITLADIYSVADFSASGMLWSTNVHPLVFPTSNITYATGQFRNDAFTYPRGTAKPLLLDLWQAQNGPYADSLPITSLTVKTVNADRRFLKFTITELVAEAGPGGVAVLKFKVALSNEIKGATNTPHILDYVDADGTAKPPPRFPFVYVTDIGPLYSQVLGTGDPYTFQWTNRDELQGQIVTTEPLTGQPVLGANSAIHLVTMPCELEMDYRRQIPPFLLLKGFGDAANSFNNQIEYIFVEEAADPNGVGAITLLARTLNWEAGAGAQRVPASNPFMAAEFATLPVFRSTLKASAKVADQQGFRQAPSMFGPRGYHFIDNQRSYEAKFLPDLDPVNQPLVGIGQSYIPAISGYTPTLDGKYRMQVYRMVSSVSKKRDDAEQLPMVHYAIYHLPVNNVLSQLIGAVEASLGLTPDVLTSVPAIESPYAVKDKLSYFFRPQYKRMCTTEIGLKLAQTHVLASPDAEEARKEGRSVPKAQTEFGMKVIFRNGPIDSMMLYNTTDIRDDLSVNDDYDPKHPLRQDLVMQVALTQIAMDNYMAPPKSAGAIGQTTANTDDLNQYPLKIGTSWNPNNIRSVYEIGSMKYSSDTMQADPTYVVTDPKPGEVQWTGLPIAFNDMPSPAPQIYSWFGKKQATFTTTLKSLLDEHQNDPLFASLVNNTWYTQTDVLATIFYESYVTYESLLGEDNEFRLKLKLTHTVNGGPAEETEVTLRCLGAQQWFKTYDTNATDVEIAQWKEDLMWLAYADAGQAFPANKTIVYPFHIGDLQFPKTCDIVLKFQTQLELSKSDIPDLTTFINDVCKAKLQYDLRESWTQSYNALEKFQEHVVDSLNEFHTGIPYYPQVADTVSNEFMPSEVYFNTRQNIFNVGWLTQSGVDAANRVKNQYSLWPTDVPVEHHFEFRVTASIIDMVGTYRDWAKNGTYLGNNTTQKVENFDDYVIGDSAEELALLVLCMKQNNTLLEKNQDIKDLFTTTQVPYEETEPFGPFLLDDGTNNVNYGNQMYVGVTNVLILYRMLYYIYAKGGIQIEFKEVEQTLQLQNTLVQPLDHRGDMAASLVDEAAEQPNQRKISGTMYDAALKLEKYHRKVCCISINTDKIQTANADEYQLAYIATQFFAGYVHMIQSRWFSRDDFTAANPVDIPNHPFLINPMICNKAGRFSTNTDAGGNTNLEIVTTSVANSLEIFNPNTNASTLINQVPSDLDPQTGLDSIKFETTELDNKITLKVTHETPAMLNKISASQTTLVPPTQVGVYGQSSIEQVLQQNTLRTNQSLIVNQSDFSNKVPIVFTGDGLSIPYNLANGDLTNWYSVFENTMYEECQLLPSTGFNELPVVFANTAEETILSYDIPLCQMQNATLTLPANDPHRCEQSTTLKLHLSPSDASCGLAMALSEAKLSDALVGYEDSVEKGLFQDAIVCDVRSYYNPVSLETIITAEVQACDEVLSSTHHYDLNTLLLSSDTNIASELDTSTLESISALIDPVLPQSVRVQVIADDNSALEMKNWTVSIKVSLVDSAGAETLLVQSDSFYVAPQLFRLFPTVHLSRAFADSTNGALPMLIDNTTATTDHCLLLTNLKVCHMDSDATMSTQSTQFESIGLHDYTLHHERYNMNIDMQRALDPLDTSLGKVMTSPWEEGFYWTKTGATDIEGHEKFTWTMYSNTMPSATTVTVDDILNMWFSCRGQGDIYLMVYTVPTGVGDFDVWYHSKRHYSISAPTTETILYTDVEPVDPLYPTAQIPVTSTDGDYLGTEEVLYVMLQTNSPELDVTMWLNDLHMETTSVDGNFSWQMFTHLPSFPEPSLDFTTFDAYPPGATVNDTTNVLFDIYQPIEIDISHLTEGEEYELRLKHTRWMESLFPYDKCVFNDGVSTHAIPFSLPVLLVQGSEVKVSYPMLGNDANVDDASYVAFKNFNDTSYITDISDHPIRDSSRPKSAQYIQSLHLHEQGSEVTSYVKQLESASTDVPVTLAYKFIKRSTDDTLRLFLPTVMDVPPDNPFFHEENIFTGSIHDSLTIKPYPVKHNKTDATSKALFQTSHPLQSISDNDPFLVTLRDANTVYRGIYKSLFAITTEVPCANTEKGYGLLDLFNFTNDSGYPLLTLYQFVANAGVIELMSNSSINLEHVNIDTYMDYGIMLNLPFTRTCASGQDLPMIMSRFRYNDEESSDRLRVYNAGDSLQYQMENTDIRLLDEIRVKLTNRLGQIVPADEIHRVSFTINMFTRGSNQRDKFDPSITPRGSRLNPSTYGAPMKRTKLTY